MNARDKVRIGRLEAKLRDMENMARQNEQEGKRVGNLTGAAMCRGQADAFQFKIGIDRGATTTNTPKMHDIGVTVERQKRSAAMRRS